MKKHLFPLALGILTLSACTSEDVVDVSPTQGNTIGFENVVNKSSRAVDGDLTNGSFDNFLVYGYYIKKGMATPIQIFNGVSVHKTTDKGQQKWVYDGTRFWVPGCLYYFYAYSCADIALVNGMGNPVFSLFDATAVSTESRSLILQQYLCDSGHQHDLVTAENEDILASEKGNKDVSLTFNHALSKVKAVFSTDFPAGYKVYITNVYMSGFYNKADYNISANSWSNYWKDVNNPASVPLSVPDKAYVENGPNREVATSEAFVIPKLYDPITNENVQLHFTIAITKDGETVLERKIIGTWSPQWVKANIYRYNINISGSSAGIEAIVFAAEQSLGSNAWDTSTQLNMVFGVDTNQ